MPLDIIIGSQWGDEGKGRFTDLLAANADITARFAGGDNAGHTITVAENIFKLHLIPSGIIQPHSICILGNGMVINPVSMLKELRMLTDLGIDTAPARILLSPAAHIITPAHLALDGALENSRGEQKLGTTKRGIGPAYTDKAARKGIRAGEMQDPEAFGKRVAEQVREATRYLESIYNLPGPDPEAAGDEYAGFAAELRDYLADTGNFLNEALNAGKNVLAEGAQGTLLDIDHGSYPFVTSSHPTVAGALNGLGIGPRHLHRIIGVTKAFQTRVGTGPFPTELFGAEGDMLRGTGANPWDEFGTTTGRARRCGWLDAVLLNYAARLNSFSELAITKLDILSGMDPLHICDSYKHNGEILSTLPGTPDTIDACSAVYSAFDGWQEDISAARNWKDLPVQAQAYIQQIEKLTGLPIYMISVGPERDALIQK